MIFNRVKIRNVSVGIKLISFKLVVGNFDPAVEKGETLPGDDLSARREIAVETYGRNVTKRIVFLEIAMKTVCPVA